MMVYAMLHFTFSSAKCAERLAVRYWQKIVSLFSRILSITIIRLYFVECVIVLILRTNVDSCLWYSSNSVWWSVHSSNRNESFPISLNRFLPFMVIFTIRPFFAFLKMHLHTAQCRTWMHLTCSYTCKYNCNTVNIKHWILIFDIFLYEKIL